MYRGSLSLFSCFVCLSYQGDLGCFHFPLWPLNIIDWLVRDYRTNNSQAQNFWGVYGAEPSERNFEHRSCCSSVMKWSARNIIFECKLDGQEPLLDYYECWALTSLSRLVKRLGAFRMLRSAVSYPRFTNCSAWDVQKKDIIFFKRWSSRFVSTKLDPAKKARRSTWDDFWRWWAG